MYPAEFDKLISVFEKLPGVGNKTAQRYAFKVLGYSEEEINEYIETLNELKKIRKCDVCGFLASDDKCPICKDDSRDKKVITVVAYDQDVIALEKIGTYNGLYHVLGGVISSSKGVYPEDLSIENLLNRIDESVKEIIIATSPTLDGEMTALYLGKILKEKGVLVTRLAHGLPMGSSLDYADELTLMKAINNRTKVE